MKKFLRSKFCLSVILVILAGLLAFVLLPKYYNTQSETMDVIQLVDDVKIGTQITEDMLAVKTIGKFGVDSTGVITDKSAIIGKYAAQDLRRASNLFVDMFSESWEDVDGAIDTLLEEGYVLVDVTIPSLAASVGGQISAGCYVNVMTEIIDAAEEEEGADDTTQDVQYDEWGFPISSGNTSTGSGALIEDVMEQTELLTHVLVYKVHNSEGSDISELDRRYNAMVESGEEEDFDDSRIPAVVTLVVTQEQAVALANQETRGYVHFVLVPDVSEDYYKNIAETAAAEREAERKAAEEAAKAAEEAAKAAAEAEKLTD